MALLVQILLLKNTDSAKKKKAGIAATKLGKGLQLEGLQKLNFICFYDIKMHWAMGTIRIWHGRIPLQKLLKTEAHKINEFSVAHPCVR